TSGCADRPGVDPSHRDWPERSPGHGCGLDSRPRSNRRYRVPAKVGPDGRTPAFLTRGRLFRLRGRGLSLAPRPSRTNRRYTKGLGARSVARLVRPQDLNRLRPPGSGEPGGSRVQRPVKAGLALLGKAVTASW